MAIAVVDIDEVKSRLNRLLNLTTSYTPNISASNPVRRAFNSDDEETAAVLEADEIVCNAIRETIGHPYATKFFTLSSTLVNGDKIIVTDSPIHKFVWSADSFSTTKDSKEAENRQEIIDAREYGATVFGATAADTYGFHFVEGGVLYTTSPGMKITTAEWVRTSLCQSPQTYIWGVIAQTIAIYAAKDGMDVNLINYANSEAEKRLNLIRGKSLAIPELEAFNLSQSA